MKEWLFQRQSYLFPAKLMNGVKGSVKKTEKKGQARPPVLLKKRQSHQKEVVYRRIMADARVANGERLPISDDAGAYEQGRSKELEEFINFRGTKRVKMTESVS